MESEGFFKPSLPHTVKRIAEIVILHAIGFYLLFNGQIAAGLCFLGLVSGRCGWLMHEGGHYSLTGMPSLVFLFKECGAIHGFWKLD